MSPGMLPEKRGTKFRRGAGFLKGRGLCGGTFFLSWVVKKGAILGCNGDFAPNFGKNAPPQGGSAGSAGIGFLIYMAHMGASKPLCGVADGLIVTNITGL